MPTFVTKEVLAALPRAVITGCPTSFLSNTGIDLAFTSDDDNAEYMVQFDSGGYKKISGIRFKMAVGGMYKHHIYLLLDCISHN